MKPSELIDSLRDDLKMEALEPDGEGVYTIVFDDGLDVEFLALSDKLLLVRSALAEVPEDESEHEEFFRRHLQQNLVFLHDQTATVSLDTETGKLWLARTAEADRLDAQGFCDLVEDFVNTLQWWRNWEGRRQTVPPPLMMPYDILRP